ncbi:MAG TPA: NnrU family protein [Gammaproteobacteria bacterium]|nr:NnrU family protein [Gammaproteobacteria bacterium]
MTMLIVGMAIFFGIHLLRVVAPGWRESMMERMGVLGWKALYSVIAIAGFVLLVLGYAEIRWSSPVLWAISQPWMKMAVGLAMLPALVVFVSAYLPGRIRATLKHPMLIATAAWAAMHLALNGRVADLLLFGAFLLWSLVVLADSYRRPAPAQPASQGSLAWDGVAVVLGTVAWWWLAFGGGHALLFGMPVM